MSIKKSLLPLRDTGKGPAISGKNLKRCREVGAKEDGKREPRDFSLVTQGFVLELFMALVGM